MGFQVALECGNALATLMSAGKELLQQKKRTERVRSVSGERPAAERRMNAEPESPSWYVGLYQVADDAEIHRSGCGPHLVSQ